MKQIGYKLLTFFITLSQYLRAFKFCIIDRFSSFKSTVKHLFHFRRTASSVLFNSGRHTHHPSPPRGKCPSRPTILGVSISQEYQGEKQIQALSRVLKWAIAREFKHVLVYEPSGLLKDQLDIVHQELQWSDPTIEDKLTLHSGWDFTLDNNNNNTNNSSYLDSPSRDLLLNTSLNNGSMWGGDDGSRAPTMHVHLLSSDDAEWPLTTAADEVFTVGGGSGSGREGTKSPYGNNSDKSKREKAMRAPVLLKHKLSQVAGPAVCLEPDILLVFGEALTLAGFPSWTVRSSEIYSLGNVEGVTWSKLDAVMKRHGTTRQRFGR